MKFLTDENIAGSVVRFLRKEGFDVKDIKEEKLHGSSDKKLIDIAHAEERIIITRDKDFAFLFHAKKHHGIILIKSKNQKSKAIVMIVDRFLQSKIKKHLIGNLVIISEDKIIVHRK
jgi:predicted nuclease of predicted toxin-antitoxin system